MTHQNDAVYKKVIHQFVPPPCFMYRIFRIKSQNDQENSNYFLRLGTRALSHWGGALVAGEKGPKNFFKLKNKRDSLRQFYESTGVW
jgi:hypothetical protein